jgi:hypothetical protein
MTYQHRPYLYDGTTYSDSHEAARDIEILNFFDLSRLNDRNDQHAYCARIA